MHIIPAIDILNGKCVRLENGDYSKKKTYSEDPLKTALTFEEAGLKKLHLIDLDGAKSSTIVNKEVLIAIIENTNLIIDFGGGIKSAEAIKTAFSLGVHQVNIGSYAATQPDEFKDNLERIDKGRVILGSDVKNDKIMTNGWQHATSINVLEFIGNYHEIGLNYFACTDINKDGTLSGPSLSLYKEILREFPKIKLIASGGIASVYDLLELRDCGLFGSIVGKAIYEGKITLEELNRLQEDVD